MLEGYPYYRGLILPTNEYIDSNDKFRFDTSLHDTIYSISINYKGDDLETLISIQLRHTNNSVFVGGEDGNYFCVDIYKIIGIK